MAFGEIRPRRLKAVLPGNGKQAVDARLMQPRQQGILLGAERAPQVIPLDGQTGAESRDIGKTPPGCKPFRRPVEDILK